MDECREWDGARTEAGYGVVRLGNRNEYVHRLSLIVKLGRPLRPGKFVCHTCDNPPCYEPNHLYEGDAQSNAHDITTRDRRSYATQARGEKVGGSKLTEAQVRAVRALLGTHKQSDIAREWGVSESTVSAIKHRRCWAWLP